MHTVQGQRGKGEGGEGRFNIDNKLILAGTTPGMAKLIKHM